MKNLENISDADLRRVLKDRSAANFYKRAEHMEKYPVRSKAILEKVQLAEKRLKAFVNSDEYKNRIRKYCMRKYFTDVEPYEVISQSKSGKTVTLRALDCKLTQAPQIQIVGGFAGHVVDNDNQHYEYTSNEDNPTFTVRLGQSGWGKGKFTMCDYPYKFYDYNF